TTASRRSCPACSSAGPCSPGASSLSRSCSWPTAAGSRVRSPPEPPSTQVPHPLEGLRAMDEDIRSELMPPSTLRMHFWECVALFAFVGVTFIKFWGDSVPPVDGSGYGHVTLVGFSLGALVLLFTLVQFYFAWDRLRRLLRSLALLPMQSGFQ